MTQCEYCELKDREEDVLYQDNDIVIAVKDNVITPGQIIVFPKEHVPILELVPEKVLEKCASMANKVSIAAFEGLGSQGTNVLVRNGLGAGQNIPHFGIEIIPRLENDNVNLQWDPKPMAEDEIEIAQQMITEQLKDSTKEKKKDNNKDNKVEIVEEKKSKKNYMLKSMRRIP